MVYNDEASLRKEEELVIYHVESNILEGFAWFLQRWIHLVSSSPS